MEKAYAIVDYLVAWFKAFAVKFVEIAESFGVELDIEL